MNLFTLFRKTPVFNQLNKTTAYAIIPENENQRREK
jgi:hypothetical protein